MTFAEKLWLLASQAINVAFFKGEPDESLSARAHRESWPKGERRIDRVLGQGHCAEVHQEQRKRQRGRA